MKSILLFATLGAVGCAPSRTPPTLLAGPRPLCYTLFTEGSGIGALDTTRSDSTPSARDSASGRMVRVLTYTAPYHSTDTVIVRLTDSSVTVADRRMWYAALQDQDYRGVWFTLSGGTGWYVARDSLILVASSYGTYYSEYHLSQRPDTSTGTYRSSTHVGSGESGIAAMIQRPCASGAL